MPLFFSGSRSDTRPTASAPPSARAEAHRPPRTPASSAPDRRGSAPRCRPEAAAPPAAGRRARSQTDRSEAGARCPRSGRHSTAPSAHRTPPAAAPRPPALPPRGNPPECPAGARSRAGWTRRRRGPSKSAPDRCALSAVGGDGFPARQQAASTAPPRSFRAAPQPPPWCR